MVNRSAELIQVATAHLLSNGNWFLEAVSCAMGSNAGKEGWKMVTVKEGGLWQYRFRVVKTVVKPH